MFSKILSKEVRQFNSGRLEGKGGGRLCSQAAELRTNPCKDMYITSPWTEGWEELNSQGGGIVGTLETSGEL